VSRVKTVDVYYRRIAADAKAPLKTRLTALREIECPSVSFLRALLRSKPPLPPAIALLAAQMLEMIIAKQKLAKEAVNVTAEKIPATR